MFWQKIRFSSFFVKLTNWEYWNFYVVYFNVIIYHLYLTLRHRKPFFFLSTNPGLENSGYIGEKKWEILQQLPPDVVPKAVFVSVDEPLETVVNNLKTNHLTYPVIAKPNVGERGQGIRKIADDFALADYHAAIGVDYIIQAFVCHPLELGIFYVRKPWELTGRITSIVEKGFLEIEGNGIETLAERIENTPRARFRKSYLMQKFNSQWHEIIPVGKKILLEEIGNHSRGTTFLDATPMITPEIEAVIHKISISIPGFYYGRFDLKVTNWEDLKHGKNIQIMELNGSGAEPAHIYQPGFSFWKGQQVLLSHWKMMCEISLYNIRTGTPSYDWKEMKKIYLSHKNQLKKMGL